MLTILSSLSYTTYKHIVKPLLFKFKPDQVHSNLLKYGEKAQKVTPIMKLMHSILAYSNDRYLGQNVYGIYFNNPVGLSAGFDKNFELVPMLKAIGFGHMEGGSVTLNQCGGNPRPWFYRLPKTKSLVVYAGLANQGVKPIVKRIQNYDKSTLSNFPINISVAKTNSIQAATETEAIEDYIGSLNHINKSKVGDIITLNISCPNTYGGEPFTTPQKLEKLLDRVDGVGLKQPIFIKMPFNLPWEDFDALLQIATTHKIAGVTISNLAKDRGQAKLMDPLPDSVKGNLSGKPTWDLSNNLIQKT